MFAQKMWQVKWDGGISVGSKSGYDRISNLF